MINLSRPARFIFYISFSFLALIGLLFAGIHVQEYVFRKRAERLSADIGSLRIRHSTFSQATEVFAGWSRSGTHSVPCGAEYCNFSIGVDWFGQNPPPDAGWYPWMVPLYKWAGGRMSFARASV